MAGRDISFPSPENKRRVPGLLVMSGLGAVALLAIGVAIGSRIGSPRDASAPLPAAAADTSGDRVPARRQERVRTERTRSGAVAAAERSITAFDGNVLLRPTLLQAVVSKIASRSARPQLLAAFAQASAQTRAKLGADTVPRPVIVLRSVPVGHRVDAFSADGATVSVWYVGIVGSGATVQPQQSWRTQTVSLVWENGAWKVRSFDASPGPTPPLSSTEATTPPGEMFTAVASFAELRDAG